MQRRRSHIAFRGALLGVFLAAAQAQTFTNPVLGRGADPSVLLVGGIYYSVGGGCPHQGGPVICLRSARSLPELGQATPVVVFQAPASGSNSADFWAPQLDLLGGQLHIYYAAGSAPGLNDHKLFALVPGTPGDPSKPWIMANTGAPNGELVTNWKSVWGIDPDVFQASDGKLYLLYACRQDNTGSRESKYQSICLSEMSDPLHLTGQTVSLSNPTQAWETRTFPTQEGPFGFVHQGVDYILYSASFSGTADDYSEALLMNDHPPQPNGKGNSLTNPAAWIKRGPVFDGHHASYGTASNVLVPSPDGTELWNIYHGTDCLNDCPMVDRKTWRDRSVRMQKAGWSPAGELVMGYPVDIVNLDGTGEKVPLAAPSTDGRGTATIPAWGAAFGDAAENDLTDGLPVGNWVSSGPAEVRNTASATGRTDRTFFGSNPNWQDYVLSTKVKLVETGGPHPRYGVYGAYVDHNNYVTAIIDGPDATSCEGTACITTDAVVDGVDKGAATCALPSGFDVKTANTVVVESAHGLFTILVNGTRLSGRCQDRQFALRSGQSPLHGSNGQVGVTVENATAEYTGFTVSPNLPLEGETYALRNRASRMELSLAQGMETPMQFPASAPYPLVASPAQLWKLQDGKDGWFQMASARNGLCLDGAGNANPSPAQRSCNGAESQLWRFIPAAESSGFLLQNKASSLVLASQGSAQGTPIALNSAAETSAQTWQLILQ